LADERGTVASVLEFLQCQAPGDGGIRARVDEHVRPVPVVERLSLAEFHDVLTVTMGGTTDTRIG
jgi:hypothetical protein